MRLWVRVRNEEAGNNTRSGGGYSSSGGGGGGCGCGDSNMENNDGTGS